MRSSSRHYHDCVADLLDTYLLSVKYGHEMGDHTDGELDAAQSGSMEMIPLVINTFGWTKGTGADVLLRVEEKAEVTHIFTFELSTQDGAWSMDDMPRIPGVRYTSLDSAKPSRFDVSPSDKRALMTMSYFHHIGKSSSSIWNTTTPLCAMPPWEVTWASAIDRIVLIGTGSEDVHRSEVLRVLNGSIVALLALDSIMPSWSESNNSIGNPPYIQGSEPPSPTVSRCTGYALVRSVRASTGTLQILTPLSPDQLSQVRVLVMGEIKLPIWGMLDHRAESKSTSQIAGVDLASVPFLQWTSGPQDALGSKRLRVRRNLMRKSQL
jgi:polynucleotide 5'-hydroxyl-kinase GRC3/NOL9